MKLYGQRWKFELDEDLVHYTRLAAPGAFKNDWLKIERSYFRGEWKITVRKGYRHDAATGVPDAKGTEEASPVHDAGYQFAKQIARAWRKTVAWVLRWFDRIFFERMVQDQAALAVAVLYYAGVRLLGYPYHVLAELWRGPADGLQTRAA